MMKKVKAAAKGILMIFMAVIGISVILILIAAVMIFADISISKAEKKKNYIPMLGSTELPEVIPTDDGHEYRRRLVSNWRIYDVLDGRAAIADINGEHPQRLVGVDENMGVVDLDGNIILPTEYRSAEFTRAGYIRTWN
ncbi:MAG: hypothetical protein IJ740_16725, partial [Ruminococcus sp.]|nr:hypothetical protein [Ruminococcus sp.]